MTRYLLLILYFLSCHWLFAQVNIDADDPNITYWGRVDFTNPKAPAFAFSGVTIQAGFTGTSITAKIYDYGLHDSTTTNYFYKIIDSGTPVKFKSLAGNNTYSLATGLTPGSHTIEIVKLTEANVGKASFLGFTVDAGSSLQPFSNEPTCDIEFIGNSITCGYGDEASIAAPPDGNPGTGFHSVNENNYNAWGYVAARNLKMRYRAVCYSGRGLYRNNTGSTVGTLPEIYDRIFLDDSTSALWNHAAHHPNYIVIDLGTNDFAPDPANPLNETGFESTYVQFVKRLKGYHPNATIILAVGVMMSDYYPVGAQQWTRITTYVKNVVDSASSSGLNNVYYFEMTPQSAPYGEDYHPTTATHASMAASLTTFINGLNIPCTASGSGFDYTILNWLDNKEAAVALSFDDWSPGHPAIVVPELKKRNMIATFYVTEALGIPNWSQVIEASDNGNEIGNHTFTHPDLTTVTPTQLQKEVRGAKYFFAEQIGKRLLTFAYPFGTYNEEVIDTVRNSNHISARSVTLPAAGNYTYNFAPTDDDYYKLFTYGMDSSVTLSQFYNQIQNVKNGGGLLTYLYHSVYSNGVVDNNYARIYVDQFVKQLDTLLSEKNNVWICTFAQAIQYHRERKTAVLKETSKPFANGSTWKLNLSDQLPDSMYFQALTLKLALPDSASNIISVVQDTNQLSYVISGGYITFDAVPDGGEIILNISSCKVPTLNLHPSNDTASFCTPQFTWLYADDAQGNSYEWFKNGVTIAGSDNDSLKVSDVGSYAVKITNNGCSISSDVLGEKVVVTNTGNCGEPDAAFKISRSPGIKLQTLTVIDLSNNVEANATYHWIFSESVIFFPDSSKGATFTGKGPLSFEFTTSGVKTITLIVTGSVKNDTIVQSVNILENAGCIMNETFDDNSYLPFIGGWNNYSFSIKSSNLEVTVPATNTNEWYAFYAYFHTGSIKQSVDFSDITKIPLIRFTARATDTLTLKVSMIDETGTMADGAILSTKNLFDVTTAYKQYELNLQGLFYNQWDTLHLDSTKIAGIVFSIDAGYQSYPFKNSFGQTVDKSFIGTLEIDWIGVNDNCTAPAVSAVNNPYQSIQSIYLFPNPANNELYLDYQEDALEWTIIKSTGQFILSGESKVADVSSLASGVYFINIGNRMLKFVKI